MSRAIVCEWFDYQTVIALVGLGSVAYGIHIAIATMTIFFAARARRSVEHLKLYCYFIVALLGCSTINYFTSLAFYIYGQSIPYGATNSSQAQTALVTIPEIMAIVVTILCNTLLIHRCYIVWNRWKPILVAPILLLAGALVGALLTVFSSLPQYPSLLSFWPILIFLNITLSALISGRIIFIQWRMRRLVGKDLSRQLKGKAGTIVALVIESSVLYTLVSGVGVPVFVSGWDVTGYMPYAFSPVLVHTECIASELIILRVILGQAITSQWASRTTNWLSTAKNQTTFHTQHDAEVALEDVSPNHRSTDAPTLRANT